MGDQERDARASGALFIDPGMWANMDLVDDAGKVWWTGRIAVDSKEDLARINELTKTVLGQPMTDTLVYQVLALLLQAGYSSRRGHTW